MRITINQALIDERCRELGIIRLSAPPAHRDAPAIAHIAALVLRLDASFCDIATITDSAPIAHRA